MQMVNKDKDYFLYHLIGMLICIWDTCTLKKRNQAQSSTSFQQFTFGHKQILGTELHKCLALFLNVKNV